MARRGDRWRASWRRLVLVAVVVASVALSAAGEEAPEDVPDAADGGGVSASGPERAEEAEPSLPEAADGEEEGAQPPQPAHEQSPPSPPTSHRQQRARTAGEARREARRAYEEHLRKETELHESGVHDGHKHLPMSPGSMMLFALTVMVTAQSALSWWRRRYYSSYMAVTLLLLWLLPLAFAASAHFMRFMLVWVAWTALTGRHMLVARARPLEKTAPRRVYSYFYLAHRACNVAAVCGYALLMGALAGAEILFVPAVHLLFYGLYFGVMCRDCAEICATRMGSTMGYKAGGGKGKDESLPTRRLPANTCAICDTQLRASVRDGEAAAARDEATFKLNCGHEFHSLCVRGWAMVGKKDTCAYCSEKVSTSELFTNFWDQKQSAAWTQILDAVRYLLAWNPVLLGCIQAVLSLMPQDVPV